jgi:signal transduction histidine kinase
VGLLSLVLISLSLLVLVAVAAYLASVRSLIGAVRNDSHQIEAELKDGLAKLQERNELVHAAVMAELQAAKQALGDIAARPVIDSSPTRDAIASELSAKVILAELTHSMKSPLLTLKGNASNLASLFPADGDSDTLQRLEDIVWGVRECELALDTFRQLVDDSSEVTRLGLLSLREAVAYLHGSTDRLLSRGTILASAVPEEVPGFSQDYLVTLLRPLVENAVEASPPGREVTVAIFDEDDVVRVSVDNAVEGPFDPDILGRPGETTKAHHSGLGLSVARRLAAMTPDGTVDAGLRDGRVVIRVDLPRRS